MKVLILGDGILGSEIHSQTGWDQASRKLGNLDIDDWWGLLNLVVKYDVIINCIAHTDSYSKDKVLHWDINYRFASDLCDICTTEGVKLIHISTEFVYANNPTPANEEELPMPDNTWYAYTKLLADEYIKLHGNNFLICRELHKPNPFPYSRVWDVKTSGDTVDKISNLIIELIKRKATGVYNVGTGDKYLKDLAPKAELISPPPHAPKDTRMNLDKLNKFLNGN